MKKTLTIIFSLMLILALVPISINNNEIKAEGETNTDNFLTFTAEEDGSTIIFRYASAIEIKYRTSTNGGEWSEWTDCKKEEKVTLTSIGDKIQYKGTNVKTNSNSRFYMTGKIAASGDVTSLTNGSGGDTPLTKSCYQYMFNSCTSLTSAPNLPSTTLAESCYIFMFKGCTSLTTAPELPAGKDGVGTLANNCYLNMFNGCTGLETAPELPATTLAESCYNSMFSGCTKISTAPELPAGKDGVGTLATNCYKYMFKDCTNLTTAPDLPATTLADNCYYYMFTGCTKLSTSPDLPATTIAAGCYSYMFQGCKSLATVPEELPAITLFNQCYSGMFRDCTSLTSAPNLPAGKDGKGSLASLCYDNMFNGCTNLTTAPDLPATTLATYCYNCMFQGCTNLITAPKLPATTLVDSCYANMFSGCTSLTEPADISHVDKLDAYCCENMYNGCTGILISDTKDATYTKAWLATSASTSAESWSSNMFASTSGAFKGSPENNKTYYLKEAATIKYSCEDVMVTKKDGQKYALTMNVTEPKDATVEYSIDGGKSWTTGNTYSIGSDYTSLGNIIFRVKAKDYKTLLVEKKYEIAPEINQSESTPSFTGITGTLSFTKGEASKNCAVDINQKLEDPTVVVIYKDGSETPIDQDNYEVTDGSTKITIFSKYLNSLSAGEHKFEVYVFYGESGANYSYNLVLTVKDNPTPPYVPVDTSCK